jgi:hypothetical protein
LDDPLYRDSRPEDHLALARLVLDFHEQVVRKPVIERVERASEARMKRGVVSTSAGEADGPGVIDAA